MLCPSFKIIDLDVSMEETIKTAVKVVQNKADGKLDMLINNAGMVYTVPVLGTNIEITKRIYDVNVFSLLCTTQHSAHLPLRVKGTIVNVGSIGARMKGPFVSQYQGTETAVEMMSRAMR
ncbi:NAD(P)-binding protein [Stipitochalara longipes BDJ]|nr:NAD(P)-binding protein [Stipitochalara longipes BDJ]